jgi:hypothetical protein
MKNVLLNGCYFSSKYKGNCSNWRQHWGLRKRRINKKHQHTFLELNSRIG